MQELGDFLKCFGITVEILSKKKDLTIFLLLLLPSEIKDWLTVSTEDQPSAEVHEGKNAQLSTTSQ